MTIRLIIVLFLTIQTVAYAGTHTAATCSLADVTTAYNAASAGDTVSIPAGSCTWSKTGNDGSNRAYSFLIDKPISLVGNGTGSTVITRGEDCILIDIRPDSDTDTTNVYRVSNMTLNLNTSSEALPGVNIGVYYKLFTTDLPVLPKVRIDHVRFTNATHFNAQAIWNTSTMQGVVDNCVFDNVYYPIRNDSGDGGGTIRSQSMYDYAFPHMIIGTAYKIYYEDNTFSDMTDGSGASTIADAQYGATYAFRYNNINNTYEGQATFDSHAWYGESAIGSKAIEIYGNRITGPTGNLSSIRGNVNVIWANSFQNAAGGTNYYLEDGYPTRPAEMCTHDSYTFLNRNDAGSLGNASTSISCTCNGLTLVPAEGRDYFDDTDNSGVRYGTAVQRAAASCTVGQGWWETDQTASLTSLANYTGKNPTTPLVGTLYKCTATDTWTAFYTPYTYPHPLRGESTSSISPGVTISGGTMK